MTEKKCKQCAMMIPKEAKICPHCRSKQGWTTCAKAGLIGILFIVLIPALSIIGKAPKNSPKVSPEQTAQQDRFNKMTPSEHLMEAKKAFEEGKPPKSFGRVDDAKKHLSAIPNNAPEYIESQKLTAEVAKREIEIQKAVKILAEKLMIEQRKDFAKKYELSLLNSGMDTTITTEGKDSTGLKMKWVLMSRPIAYKIINDESAMSNLKNIGFKKIIFTDGHDSTWSIDLTK